MKEIEEERIEELYGGTDIGYFEFSFFIFYRDDVFESSFFIFYRDDVFELSFFIFYRENVDLGMCFSEQINCNLQQRFCVLEKIRLRKLEIMDCDFKLLVKFKRKKFSELKVKD